jgi:hypothetical protein
MIIRICCYHKFVPWCYKIPLTIDSANSLQETGITLSAQNFLEGQNQTVKEYTVSLAVLVNSQGNIYSLEVDVNRQGIWVFPWRFPITSKKMTYFLECYS